FRPLLESRDKRFLGKFFGNADVSRNAGNRCDEACGLDPPHGLDRPVNVTHGLAAVAFGRSAKPSAPFCTSSGKSLISWIWRTSIISLSAIGARFAHSMASSRERTCMIQ